MSLCDRWQTDFIYHVKAPSIKANGFSLMACLKPFDIAVVVGGVFLEIDQGNSGLDWMIFPRGQPVHNQRVGAGFLTLPNEQPCTGIRLDIAFKARPKLCSWFTD